MTEVTLTPFFNSNDFETYNDAMSAANLHMPAEADAKGTPVSTSMQSLAQDESLSSLLHKLSNSVSILDSDKLLERDGETVDDSAKGDTRRESMQKAMTQFLQEISTPVKNFLATMANVAKPYISK